MAYCSLVSGNNDHRKRIFSKTLFRIFLVRRRLTLVLGCVQTDATLLTNNSQHCWMLHVASVCTLCCMLLDVVACCCAKFETGHTFSPVQTDATLLANNSQHCWELLRPFSLSLSRAMHTCFMGIFLRPHYNAQIRSGFSQKLRSKLSMR